MNKTLMLSLSISAVVSVATFFLFAPKSTFDADWAKGRKAGFIMNCLEKIKNKESTAAQAIDLCKKTADEVYR